MTENRSFVGSIQFSINDLLTKWPDDQFTFLPIEDDS